MNTPSLGSRLGAEALGTFVLVLGGCGSAVLAARFVIGDGADLGVGLLGVALAFGLSVLVMAYAVGAVSGGHFNPAVTLGATFAGRTEWRCLLPYWLAQVVGGSLGAMVLFAVASGRPGFDAVESGFASNGYGERSPGGYGLLSALLIEVVLTAVFLWVILGATDRRAARGFAPVAIGLALTLIHLISIPVTNTSVNPARSLATAWFAGPEALAQVWLFLLAPLVGAFIAGCTYHLLFPDVDDALPEPGAGSRPVRADRPVARSEVVASS